MAEEAEFRLDESTLQGIKECLANGNTPVRITEVDFSAEPRLGDPYLYD